MIWLISIFYVIGIPVTAYLLGRISKEYFTVIDEEDLYLFGTFVSIFWPIYLGLAAAGFIIYIVVLIPIKFVLSNFIKLGMEKGRK